MASTLPLQDLTALVRPELERMNLELAADLRPDEQELAALVEQVGRYRGKQLRPALVLLSGKAMGRLTPEHLTVAKVVELIHLATLVHDDILDEARLRRQVMTVNGLHGNEVAVLLGDYIYARAFQMAVGMADQTCSRVLADVTRVICQGEITQILHSFDFDWTEDRYFRVIAEKTASLYEAACRLGGHYAGGGSACLEALAAYGRELGIAFQIVDDCLDLRGEEGIVGKSLGSDFAKGKLTLPLLYLMCSSGDGGRRLRRVLGSDGGLLRLRSEFDLEAAVAYSLAQARHRVGLGLEAVRHLPAGPAREAMQQLAEFVLQRNL